MTEYYKIVRYRKNKNKKLDTAFSWEHHLNNFEKGKASFIPVDAFSTNLLVDLTESLQEGIIFETVIHDYDEFCDGSTTIRWFAKVEKVCGYRVLARYIGIGSSPKFWINLLSDEVMYLAKAPLNDATMSDVAYAPPLAMNEAYKDDLENYINTTIDLEVVGQHALGPKYEEMKNNLSVQRFRVGQRLELLNYTLSTEIRVARIQEICGRRINVLVTKKDFSGKIPSAEDDRQFMNPGAQYWIDEESFFIFPVGFAALNNYKLNAKKEYVEYTKKIAEAIRKGETPRYEFDDIKFEQLPKKPIDKDLWSKVKKGQKFELIDPLAQQFNNLHVATVIDFLPSDGYMIVGMDGPDMMDDSFPIHINNMFMYPVGYAAKYGLALVTPDGYKGKFKWADHLKNENAEALPLDLFRPMPPQSRLDKFKAGMRLEAADMCENQLICPATIKSIHGRIINVNFDGWDEEFDELYDIDSHDILPIGWCEFHNYVLQQPKV